MGAKEIEGEYRLLMATFGSGGWGKDVTKI